MNIDNSFLLNDSILTKKYHPLIVRLNSIYGPCLTVRSLLNIDFSEFADHKGVGVKYVSLFKEFKDIISAHIKENSSESFSAEYEGITADNINSTLFLKIKKCFPHIKSFLDIYYISPEEFSKFPGVGKKKVQQLRQLQGRPTVDKEKSILSDDEITQLENYRFSALLLTHEENKLLLKLQKLENIIKKIAPTYFMKIKQADMKSWKGFGKKYFKVLQSLQNKIVKSIKNSDVNSILISNQFCHSFDLKRLCPIMVEDLSLFFSTLSVSNKIVWCTRSGYQNERMTLHEIGVKLNVTRERIRQLSKKLNNRFLSSMRINPQILKEKIKSKTRVELFYDLKELRSMFNTDNDLIRMIALLSNENDKDLILKFNPIVRRNILDHFFLWHPFPAKRYEIFSYLHDELGGTDEKIEIYFSALKNAKIIKFRGNNVIPLELGKELAISHILAGYPKGLDWKEVAKKVNEAGICRTDLSLIRPDTNLNISSYNFLSGRHLYSHICFFPIGKEQVSIILEEVKSFIVSSNHKTMHLMAAYYAKLNDPPFDYYVIRHAIRTFGESYGLFFNGKSQSDTVSLSPMPKAISQKEAIKRLFVDKGLPLTVQEITQYIKSQSESHARLYIDELTKSGDIVSVDVNLYQIRSNAFNEINIEFVRNSIQTLLNDDKRFHHIAIITNHMNRIGGYDYSNRFWRSFCLAFAGEMNWFVRGIFISLNNIKIRGLSELVQQNRGMTQEDLISTIQQKVCVSRDEIKRAISNEKSNSQESIYASSETQGLASGIMEELFLL